MRFGKMWNLDYFIIETTSIDLLASTIMYGRYLELVEKQCEPSITTASSSIRSSIVNPPQPFTHTAAVTSGSNRQQRRTQAQQSATGSSMFLPQLDDSTIRPRHVEPDEIELKIADFLPETAVKVSSSSSSSSSSAAAAATSSKGQRIDRLLLAEGGRGRAALVQVQPAGVPIGGRTPGVENDSRQDRKIDNGCDRTHVTRKQIPSTTTTGNDTGNTNGAINANASANRSIDGAGANTLQKWANDLEFPQFAPALEEELQDVELVAENFFF